MKSFNWIARRWLEFRTGHNTYLSFLLSFTNFFLIVYNLLIAKIPVLSSYLSNLWIFSLIGLSIYIPLAILIGHSHNKTQLTTDNLVTSAANPYTTDIIARLQRIEDRLEDVV